MPGHRCNRKVSRAWNSQDADIKKAAGNWVRREIQTKGVQSKNPKQIATNGIKFIHHAGIPDKTKYSDRATHVPIGPTLTPSIWHVCRCRRPPACIWLHPLAWMGVKRWNWGCSARTCGMRGSGDCMGRVIIVLDFILTTGGLSTG